MSETTIAAPLSGEEISDFVMFELQRAMRRDCYLNPALGYEAFEGELTGTLRLRDNGRIAEVHISIRFEERPPNAIRERAGLPIPTLIEGSTGKKEVKGVQYAPSAAAKKPAPEEPEEEPPAKPGSEPKAPKPEPEQPAERRATRVVR